MFDNQSFSRKATLSLLMCLGLALLGAGSARAAVAIHDAAALPAQLRPALYQALDKDAGAAYAVRKDGCAALPGQSLEGCFDARGVHFKGNRASPLGLRLVAFGRSGALHPIASVQPEITANRARYVHGVVNEWWHVLPVGFEQGFTVVKPPRGQGALTFVLAVNRAGSPHGDDLAFGELHYGALSVSDANGKPVPATLDMQGHRIVISVNDVGAVYPLVVDPLVWLEQKEMASDGAADDEFGTSVAVDDMTAVIGAPHTTVGGNAEQGAAYVFTESDGVWSQAAKLVSGDGFSGNHFGYSVAISGTTVFVGAPYASSVGDAGAAYVFDNADGTWTQTAELTANDAELGDNLGWSIAASGNTVVSGAVDKRSEGAAYVFKLAGGKWKQTGELTASDAALFDSFGISVAIAGNTILVGDDSAPGNGQYFGEAYIFSKTDQGWEQTAILTPSDAAAGDFFGYGVALSKDGNTALVGAYYKNLGKGYQQGAAYVFNNTNDTWNQTQELTLGDNSNPGDDFGEAVALNDDGTAALVGGPGVNVGDAEGVGAGFIFTNSGGTWSQTQEFTASDGVKGDYYGIGVALDGTTALVGSPQFSNDVPGGAYFYGQSDLALAVSAPAHVSPGSEFVSQVLATNSSSASSPAVSVTVAVPAAASFVSATATQGSCSEASGVVNCDLGPIAGNVGMATANVTLKATGSNGDTVVNTASVVKATPALTASAVTAIATDHAPVANNSSLMTDENKAASGTLKATDADGDPLTFSIVNQPSNGSVTLDDAATGAYTYTPDKSYSGSDSFTFKANDGEEDSNTAKISITVNKAASGGGGGGGGATAPLGLLLLAFAGLAALARRRH